MRHTGWEPRARHSQRYEAELRRLKRRTPKRGLIVVIILGALGVLAAIEFGRAMSTMNGVQAFLGMMPTMSNEAIRSRLDEYALLLRDRNPLVRNGAISAMKAATGWRFTGPLEWREQWVTRRAAWEYHHTGPQPRGADPQLQRMLEGLTNDRPATVPEVPAP